MSRPYYTYWIRLFRETLACNLSKLSPGHCHVQSVWDQISRCFFFFLFWSYHSSTWPIPFVILGFGLKEQIERHSHLLSTVLYLISLGKSRMGNRNWEMQLDFLIQKCNIKYLPPLSKRYIYESRFRLSSKWLFLPE
jgi:hypothetical protein